MTPSTKRPDGGEPFVSGCCGGEKCHCGVDAAHKVEETIFYDDPIQTRHPLTTYLCHPHFVEMMGPAARYRGETADESPALQATKKSYIKPLRTIVEIDARYADQIRDLLNAPAPQPPVEGLREALEPFVEYHRQLREKFPDSTSDTIIVGGPYNLTYAHFEALLAALASPSLTAGWQPIETAPKDGTEILVTDARTLNWTHVCFWDDEGDRRSWRWARADCSAFYHAEMFTHWMPVPKAPAAPATLIEQSDSEKP